VCVISGSGRDGVEWWWGDTFECRALSSGVGISRVVLWVVGDDDEDDEERTGM
jgi:hypothetical protein